MMNPEMMKMAQEMMSKMSPEQLAQMQRQAANFTPEQLKAAEQMAQNMTPEQMKAAQAAATSMPASEINSKMSAQQKYQYDASISLKEEGNTCFRINQYSEASSKYKRALENIMMHTSNEAKDLRISCLNNLASCQLNLTQYADCVNSCAEVLSQDISNRKALYRRGQARMKLKQIKEAVHDLEKALHLSPATEKAIIQEKLEEARKELQYQANGVIIEEITEKKEEKEGVPKEEPIEVINGDTNRVVQPPPPPPSSHMPDMAMNPDMIKTAAKMMETMSDEDLERMAAAMPGGAGGVPGLPAGTKIDRNQVKMAAKMMETMSPDDLKKMTEMAKAMGAVPGGRGSNGSTSGGGTDPVLPNMMDNNPEMMAHMQKVMAEPETMKKMQDVLKNMDDETLASMMSQGGMKMTPEQARKMANHMGNLDDKQLELIGRLIRGVSTVAVMYKKTKAWMASNAMVVLALVILVLGLLLRWLGWA